MPRWSGYTRSISSTIRTGSCVTTSTCGATSPQPYARRAPTWSSPSITTISSVPGVITRPITSRSDERYSTEPRDAANRWVFPELVSDQGLAPWKAQRILVSGSPQSNAFVDVTASFDAGVASLAAHQQYLAGLGDHAMGDPRIFLEQIARSTEERVGVQLAVSFEVVEL